MSRLTHANPTVTDVDFSPDGRYVATASWDGAARVWGWLPEDLIELASSRVQRALGAEEWAQYLPGEPYHSTGVRSQE